MLLYGLITKIAKHTIMGLIARGILGNLSGKLSNIQGANWKGRDTIQGWNDRKGAVWTQPQINQRTKMGWVRWYGEGVRYYISTILGNRRFKRIGAWAQYCKQIIQVVDETGAFEYQNFYLGTVRLPPRFLSLSVYTGSPAFITCNLAPYSLFEYNGSQVLSGVYYFNTRLKKFGCVSALWDSNPNTVAIVENEWEIGDEVWVWCYAFAKGTYFVSQPTYTSIIVGV